MLMKKIGFIGLIGLIVPIFVFAALPPTTDSIIVSFSPENPAPNTFVEANISLLPGTGAISEFNVEWKLNGKVVKDGRGEARYSFRTGKLGTATEIIITLSENGESISKTISLKPASVVLVGESDGTVPPFYKGKTLFSYHGSTRIAAIPFFVGADGKRISPKSLVYTWRIADRVPEGSSGVGRDTFTFYAKTPFRPTEIEVETATADGNVVAKNIFTAEARPANLALYEENPLYGVLWNKALSASVALSSPEMRINAEPFFFNKNDERLLNFKWTMNSNRIGSQTDKSITLRKENAAGEAFVDVEVTNPKAMFQFGEAKTTIQF